jgi:hypothetical protein
MPKNCKLARVLCIFVHGKLNLRRLQHTYVELARHEEYMRMHACGMDTIFKFAGDRPQEMDFEFERAVWITDHDGNCTAHTAKCLF